MYIAVGPPPCITGAPGWASWTSVAPLRNSALFTTAEPAMVTGPVAPRIGMG